jgi:hypothetical protein
MAALVVGRSMKLASSSTSMPGSAALSVADS